MECRSILLIFVILKWQFHGESHPTNFPFDFKKSDGHFASLEISKLSAKSNRMKDRLCVIDP